MEGRGIRRAEGERKVEKRRIKLENSRYRDDRWKNKYRIGTA